MDSDQEEEEVSCDLPIEDEAEAANNEAGAALSEDDEGSLDWSVSAISGAMDPDRFHSEASSSAAASPDRRREIHRLAGQFKTIQTNLQHISRKSVTPVASPRRPGEDDSRPAAINVVKVGSNSINCNTV